MDEYTPRIGDIRRAWFHARLRENPYPLMDTDNNPFDDEFDRWLAEHDREVAESIAAWADSGPRRQFAAWASHEVVKEEFLNHAEIAEAIRGGEYAASPND